MCVAGAEEAIRLAPIADDNPARRKIVRIDLMVFKYVDYISAQAALRLRIRRWPNSPPMQWRLMTTYNLKAILLKQPAPLTLARESGAGLVNL